MTTNIYEYSFKRTPIAGGSVDSSAEGSKSFVVDRLGVSGSYRVVMFDRDSCIPIEKKVSKSDGSITFIGIDKEPDRFFVVAFDTVAGGEKPAISDFIEGE